MSFWFPSIFLPRVLSQLEKTQKKPKRLAFFVIHGGDWWSNGGDTFLKQKATTFLKQKATRIRHDQESHNHRIHWNLTSTPSLTLPSLAMTTKTTRTPTLYLIALSTKSSTPPITPCHLRPLPPRSPIHYSLALRQRWGLCNGDGLLRRRFVGDLIRGLKNAYKL